MSDERYDPRDPDADLAGRFLREVTADTEPGILPTAGQLWWRAAVLRRLAEQDARAERAVRPALWGVAAILFALVLGLSYVLASGAGFELLAVIDASPSGYALPLLLVPMAILAPLLAVWQET